MLKNLFKKKVLIDQSILDRVERNDPTLTSLILAPEKNGANFTDDDIIALCTVMKAESPLKKILLRSKKLTHLAAEALAKTNIIELTVSVANFGDLGAQALAASQTLQHLELNSTGIGPKGFGVLFTQNSSLKSIKLGINHSMHIGDHFGDLGGVIPENNPSRLETVEIQTRGGDGKGTIYDRGIEVLASIKTLRWLSIELYILKGCLSDTAAIALAKTKLVYLSIIGQRITDKGAQEFLLNTTLTDLKFNKGNQTNLISAGMLVQIEEHIKRNIAAASKSITTPATASSSSSQTPQVLAPLPLDSSFLVPYNRLTLGERLGEGAYGIVYKAQHGYETVAVKQLNIKSTNTSAVTALQSEAEQMAQLHSNYAVRLLGFCQNPPCLLLEFMVGGSLYDFLQEKLPSMVSWSLRLQIALDICYGLAYLHNKNVIHRDLKSLNVLLDEKQEHAKLSDFGLTTTKAQSASAAKTQSACGTAPWMAPELLDADNQTYDYNAATDIYALAMVLWELASHQTPFQTLNQIQIMGKILKGQRPEIPADTPVQYQQLIINAWSQDAKKRSSIDSIITVLNNLKQIEQQTAATPANPSGYMSLS